MFVIRVAQKSGNQNKTAVSLVTMETGKVSVARLRSQSPRLIYMSQEQLVSATSINHNQTDVYLNFQYRRPHQSLRMRDCTMLEGPRVGGGARWCNDGVIKAF